MNYFLLAESIIKSVFIVLMFFSGLAGYTLLESAILKKFKRKRTLAETVTTLLANILRIILKGGRSFSYWHIFYLIISTLPIIFIPFYAPQLLWGKVVSSEIVESDYALLIIVAFGLLRVFPLLIWALGLRSHYFVLSFLRELSHTMASQLSFLLIIGAVFFHYDTFNLHKIVLAQQGEFYPFISSPAPWTQFFAALLFFVCMLIDCKWPPFDNTNGDREIAYGLKQNISSFDEMIVRLSFKIQLFLMCLLFVILFLGGYNELLWLKNLSLRFQDFQICFQVLSLMIKCGFVLIPLAFIKLLFTRFRSDKVVLLGWRTLVPLSFLNLLLTVNSLRAFT